MRLFQAMAGAEYGGAEAFFTRLALAFQRAGVEQAVAIRRNAKRAAQLRAGGIEPLEVRFGGPLDLLTPWSLKRHINSFAPDLVLTWMNRASRACPLGNFVHVGRLGGYYDLKYYRGCKHLIGNTRDIVNYVVGQGWPTERVHYLPNFVDGTRMEPLRRRDFFTPEDAPLVLGMGRLHEHKAFDILIRAMVRVPDAYLWLAGEGPLRKELEALCEDMGVKPRVRFLGWREDTAALLATCSVFVCPSRHEPLGNVVLEAWAQGTPVIAADSIGPRELIEDGIDGLLVGVDRPKDLGDALRQVLRDGGLRLRLAQEGYTAYRRGFTEEIVVGRYQQFFSQVLS